MPSTELATFDVDSRYPVLSASGGGEDMAELLQDNQDGEALSLSALPGYKIANGGVGLWEPTEEDSDNEMVKELTGVLVHWGVRRAYFEKDFDERDENDEDKAPQCSSADGKVAVSIGRYAAGSQENPSGKCETCPMNQWGSTRRPGGKGKACAEKREVWMLLEGDDQFFPIRIMLPPSSIKAFKGYMDKLTMKRKNYRAVTTNLGQIVQKNGATRFGVAAPKIGDALPKEVFEKAKALGAQIQSLIEATDRARMEATDATADTSDNESPFQGGSVGNPGTGNANDPWGDDDEVPVEDVPED